MPKSAPYQQIGHRIRAARLVLGLSQKEMCERVGAQETAYSQWETGARRPNLDTAIRLAEIHGVTLDWIYLGDDGGLTVAVRDRLIPFLARQHSKAAS